MRAPSEADPEIGLELLHNTVQVAAAFVSRNAVAPGELPEVIQTIHASLAALAQPAQPLSAPERRQPAVPIARSVHHDHLVCLEDGKRLKMLKRYLRAKFDLTPEEYRRRWGLPPDYPMVAPAYAERRSHFAKALGLGARVRRR